MENGTLIGHRISQEFLKVSVLTSIELDIGIIIESDLLHGNP